MRSKLKTFTFTFDTQFQVETKDSFILVNNWLFAKYCAAIEKEKN